MGVIGSLFVLLKAFIIAIEKLNGNILNFETVHSEVCGKRREGKESIVLLFLSLSHTYTHTLTETCTVQVLISMVIQSAV